MKKITGIIRPSYRVPKCESLVSNIIAHIFSKEIDLPIGIFPSVTKVQVTKDLEHARVWLSVIPATRRKELLEFLQSNIYHIQGYLNAKFVMKKKPRIKFLVDAREDKADKIESLIKEIHEEEKRKK